MEKENTCRFCTPADEENRPQELTHTELDFGTLGKLSLVADISEFTEPKLMLHWLLLDDDVILKDDRDRFGIPIKFCPVCGRNLRQDKG